MKKHLLIILSTTFMVGNIIATLCFRACKKRVDITDFWHWKVVDSDWEHFIEL